jgi:hypothetical protein
MAGGMVFAAAAGETVAGVTVAGGTVAGGTVAVGGTVTGGVVAGGTVFAAGDAVGAGPVPDGLDDAGVPRGETGGGAHSAGLGPAGRSGRRPSVSPSIDGGHAGIVCSVGGSGGQMSLWVGSSASACTFGGQVSGADLTGSAGGVGSGSPAGSAGAGTVCAQDGAGFCIGTAGFGSVSSSTFASVAGSSADGSDCAHDGFDFCIGSAGLGSVLTVASVASTAPADWSSSSGWVSTVPSIAPVPSADWGTAGGAVADGDCKGSSGSVSGSKACVTRGSSGSAASPLAGAGSLPAHEGPVSRTASTGGLGFALLSVLSGSGGFSSCGSTPKSVYRRGNKIARRLRRIRSSVRPRRSGRAAAPPSRRPPTLPRHNPPASAPYRLW